MHISQIKQTDIAKALDISDAYLSQIFAGIYEPGKATARKMGDFTGLPWTDFLTMPPDQIRIALFEAAARAAA